jgi:phosphate transport system substrate-binding protein
MNKTLFISAGLLSALSIAAHAEGRNYLYIVGSTTVQPFSEEVAKHIAKSAKLKSPLIEANGTNGGFTLFCESASTESPDIVNASRAIKPSEFATCQNNGVSALLEVKIGYDGIVIAHNKTSAPLELTRKDLYLALAKQVPDPNCKQACDTLVANPYKTWKQVNPTLPDTAIDIVGPPVSSGTMEVFAEAVMEAGCDSYPALAAKRSKNLKEYHRACHNLREDGVYTEETSENIAGQLAIKPDTLGILSFSRLKGLQTAKLEGVAPNYDSIASQNYSVSRPVYFYAKLAHVDQVPGFKAFLAEFTNDKAVGPKGYLLSKGLIAMPVAEQKRYAADVKALKPIDSPVLP